MLVTYNAKRDLAVGSIMGAGYTLEIQAVKLDPSYDVDRTESIALGGATQVVVNRDIELYSVQTDHIEVGTDEYAKLYEFAQSVRQFEQFTFDEHGIEGQPDNPRPAILTAPYARKRIGQKGIFTFSFEIRILP